MNVMYPKPETPPGRDPNAVLYVLGLALIAGVAFAMWLLV